MLDSAPPLLLVHAALSYKLLVYASLSAAAPLQYPWATSVCVLKLLVYKALLLVYEALSY
jgi:hypothetical protein